MICIQLNGGLGNQLFQYATGRALALRNNCELLLDTSLLSRNTTHVTPRDLELHHFQVNGRVTTSLESAGLILSRSMPVLSSLCSPWRVYVEKGKGYNANLLSLPDQTYLLGYWQSFLYFTGIANAVSAELQIAKPLSATSQAIAVEIDATNSVAIHVRRGDYVSLAMAARFHGTLQLPYYLAALARVREQVCDARYYVFSDDVDWCRKHLPISACNTLFVNHNTGNNAWQDLELMSRCRHHVIANSSFSWWGAWLADQRRPSVGRVVIAPNRWFAAVPDLDLSDRLPPHWIRQI